MRRYFEGLRPVRIAIISCLLIVATLVVAILLYTPSTDEESVLSWEQLRNAAYPLELPRARVAPLRDGLYEEEIAPGSATRLRVQLADIAGFGPIDAGRSNDAAAVLIGSPGGSGTFIYLAAVLNEESSAIPVATTLLGDRVAVRSIRIEEGRIVVGMRVRGPSDPLVMLTREVTRTYLLRDGELVLEQEETAELPSTPPGQFTFEPVRLSLDAGRSLTQQGVLQPGSLQTYLVYSSAGQILTATVRSQFNNAILSIQGVGDTTQLVSRSNYATTWTDTLPVEQDYAVTVVTLAGNDLSFELKLELKQAATPTPTARPQAASTPRPTATQPGRPSPTPTRPPEAGAAPAVPAPLRGQFRPPLAPLSGLAPSASQFLEGRAPTWGAAVVLPGTSTIYAANGDEQFELASVVKVLVALAVMDAAQRENRYVDRFELSLLWPMITISDNDSTTELWDELGGGRGLSGYLATIGVNGIKPFDGAFWGTSTASPNSMATVVARAVFGDLLNSEHRALLISLLDGVSPEQRWGITARIEGDGGTGARVGLKNGWYFAEAGWRVNSVGFVVDGTGRTFYVLAALTNQQPSWSYGIQSIEGFAGRVNSELLKGP